MVKLLLSVVAIVISLYCAFYCGVFEKSAPKHENLCYGELGTVRDPKRYPRFNVRESRNWESNRDQSPTRADEPSSKTPSLCPPRNFERSPQSLSPTVERFGPKFSATNVESSEEDCYCVDDKDDLYFPRQLIDPSVKDLDYAKSPRATSTRLVSDDPCKKSSQQTSSGNKNFANTYGKSLCDIEKCCDLFFGSDKKNDIDDISRGDKAERLDIPPVNSVGRVKNVAAEGELVPPDGGWGWLVLLASVMVNVLIPGTIKSFGVLFVEFLEVFDASPAAAAWIPSLCYFLYSSLGPLSSILSVKYSYRTVTLIGGTFAAAGMMLSYFASSVGFLCVSYGVFVGIGAGLSFPPTVYIVTSYFVRFRGLANGLCISGSALGSIFLPPILGFLLEEYGYRGAVLLMGAVTLNVWASALLYEPVEKHMKRVPISSEPEDEDEMEAGTAVGTSPEDEKKLNNLLIIPNSKTDAAAPIVPKSASSVALENYKNTPIQGRTRKISVPTGRDLASQMHSTPALYAVPERGGFESGRLSKRRTAARSPSSSSFNYVSTPYHGSTLSVLHPEHASTMTLHAITSTFARKSPEKTVKTKPRSNAKFFDISLLKDPVYLVILISNSTNAVSYTNFVILLPAYAISLHFDKHMSWLLLSTVSVLDLIGRIGGSALSDIQIMPKHWYFVGGLFVSGISLALLPLATSYIWLSIYCGVFGLASGIYVGVTAVIMADMLGTEKLTSSYGISLFVNGVLQLVGPPICGLIFEHIGSYGPIFSILGIILVAGASLWGFMPLIKRRQRLAATAAQADKL